ncbi:hypothetical protein FRB99_001138 [Tulasnella sp. 403]|nr:hypothetical protein FRB99_001138 [Tulasnella sp. 403]
MELVPFAYDVFKKSKDQGLRSPSDELCDKFKATFARSVEVHFVGLWDTVSSVGLWPRSLPNTNQNKSVKIVRHALSLDENRAKFKAEPWSKPTKAQAEADGTAVHVSEDETDIKEVWFSGYHGDVGGGNEKTTTMNSLSNIPLRWLVREAMEHTSIRWKPQVLETFHIHKRDEMSEETRMEYIERECQEAIHAKTNGELQNAFSPWWILEVLPLWHLWWDGAASAWVPTISWNIGAPRQIGSEGREDQRTFVHSSVSTRLWLNGDYVNAAKWKESEVEVVDDWATPEVVRKRRRQEGRNLPVKEEKRRPWWRWLF